MHTDHCQSSNSFLPCPMRGNPHCSVQQVQTLWSHFKQGSLLVLSTLSSPTSMRTPKEKQLYTLMLVFCLVCPNFLVFVKSLWRCAFKSFVRPNIRTMSFVGHISFMQPVILQNFLFPILDLKKYNFHLFEIHYTEHKIFQVGFF